ncbi:hypothetical protein PVA38_12355 [Streptococcus pneumoniae D39]|nr:hypothetical protein PVA38_12355 [Streptococcus pneumoniae D39]
MCIRDRVYQHYFDKLLQGKDHVLSQREEELLAGAGEIFGSASETFAILDNADIVFPYVLDDDCLLYTSPSPRDRTRSRMPSSA